MSDVRLHLASLPDVQSYSIAYTLCEMAAACRCRMRFETDFAPAPDEAAHTMTLADRSVACAAQTQCRRVAIPLELQFEILRFLQLDLESMPPTAVNEETRRNTYVASCLVSQAWAAQVQRLLYRRVVLVPGARAVPFYASIISNNALGTLVEEMHVHGLEGFKRLVQSLHLLPSLRRYEGPWPRVGELPPLPTNGRRYKPRIEELVIDSVGASFGWNSVGDSTENRLGAWLNLSSVRRLEVVGGWSRRIERHFEELDRDEALQELVITYCPSESVPSDVIFGAANHLRLLEVSMLTSEFGVRADEPSRTFMLAAYPTLRRLTLSSHWVIPFLLCASGPVLSILSIDCRLARLNLLADGRLRLLDLIKILGDVCHRGTARFPLLRGICILHTAGRGAVESVLRPAAAFLAASQLRLVDEDGFELRL